MVHGPLRWAGGSDPNSASTLTCAEQSTSPSDSNIGPQGPGEAVAEIGIADESIGERDGGRRSCRSGPRDGDRPPTRARCAARSAHRGWRRPSFCAACYVWLVEPTGRTTPQGIVRRSGALPPDYGASKPSRRDPYVPYQSGWSVQSARGTGRVSSVSRPCRATIAMLVRRMSQRRRTPRPRRTVRDTNPPGRHIRFVTIG